MALRPPHPRPWPRPCLCFYGTLLVRLVPKPPGQKRRWNAQLFTACQLKTINAEEGIEEGRAETETGVVTGDGWQLADGMADRGQCS